MILSDIKQRFFSNLTSEDKQKVIFYVIGFVGMVLLLIYFLIPSNTTRPINPDQPNLISESADGKVVLYEDGSGARILEVSDPNITEEQARKELGLSDEENVEFVVPGVALPRSLSEKEIEEEKQSEEIDYDEWGLDPNYSD